MTNSEWREAWSALKMPRVYETELGDIVLPCIAHCVKKDVLVFNTSSNAHYAVYVIESSMLDGQANETEIPICLAYDQTHYEPLVPNTEEDILETINLKKSIIDGSYKDKRNEIAFLTNEPSQYAKAVKRGLNSMNSSSKNEHWLERKVMKEVGNKKLEESFKHKVKKTDDCRKKCSKIIGLKTKKQSQMPIKRKTKNIVQAPSSIVLENKFSCLSESDTKNFHQLDSLKKIGKKDRTEAQNILYNNLMKEKRREKNKQSMADRRNKQSIEEKHVEKRRDRQRKVTKRKDMSVEEKILHNTKERERKAGKKTKQTVQQTSHQNAKDRERKAAKKANQSVEETAHQNAKDKERKAAKKANQSVEQTTHQNAKDR